MLKPTRLLLRDAASRALLLATDLRGKKVHVEGTATTFRVEDLTAGTVLVDAPMAHLELIDSDSVQYQGVARIRDSRELRHLRIILELG
ncbi:hypothetical protein [Cellulomonas hominis]|nr:hypothetical protein AGMMS50218_07390 [Actinomycetota bacterium]